MSEFSPSPIGQQESESQGVPPVEEEQIISMFAAFRRRNVELRANMTKLEKPSDPLLAEKFDVEADQINQELGGNVVDSEESADKLAGESEGMRKKAETFLASAPILSALIYAKLAKMELSQNIDFGDSLHKAEQAIDLSKDLQKSSPKTFLPEAMIIGIIKRTLFNKEMPSLENMARLATENPKVISDIALALTEDQREDFLNLLPQDKKEYFSAIMDRELAGVLKSNLISEAEKPQQEAVRARAEKALNQIIQLEDQTNKQVIRFLAESLATLGDEESKQILKNLADKELKGHEYGDKLSALKDVIRSLAEVDNFSGGRLAMELLSKPELPERYFRYFRDYLARTGFLAKNLDQANNWPDNKCSELFEFLQEKEPDWQDEANVTRPFKEGVGIFGWQKMFGYAGRPDVTRHDALFSFDKILTLYKQSGLSAEQFYGQILGQVYSDGASYESGTSYNELNSIASAINLSDERFMGMKRKIAQYPKIQELQNLGEFLGQKEKVFSSWNSLKKFTDLSQLLERAEILGELNQLEEVAARDPRKAKLAKFIKTLAFHPDSKVNMQSVLEFWRQPEIFFESGDAQMTQGTELEVHNAKKPSNYVDIPNLDLTAVQLRDALVEGDLDKIQAFLPMEIVYTLNKQQKISEDLSFADILRREVGSRRDNTANGPLFAAVNRLFREKNLNTVEFLQGKNEIMSTLAGVEQRELEEKLRELVSQFPNPKIEHAPKPISRHYRARVNQKSDPQAVLAGNDTSCCMPFGSGKNNIYMFNPDCALFTLEEEKGEGKWRTIAQSVLTLDLDINRSVPEVASAIKNSRGNLSEILPDSVLKPTKHYLACDNVEVAQNAMGKKKIIEALYRQFFQKYLPYYNQSNPEIPIDEEKVVVGPANSDFHFPNRMSNTFIPAAPVGYSDKYGSEVETINFNRSQTEAVSLTEESIKQEQKIQNTATRRSGVTPLTFKDSLGVAYLEGKAYSENTSLITCLHNMENGLIAKDINNEAKHRPNLSTKYVDENGRMRGYLLAYEGVDDDNQSPVIFLSDLASDRQSVLAGGRLINSFIDSYHQNYLEKNRLLPILMQARESTSYQIIQNQLQAISKRLGVRFEVEERNVSQQGNDRMHELLLRPVKF